MSRTLPKLLSVATLCIAGGWFASAAMANVVTDAGTDALQWRFEVFLDDKPIGFHDYRIERDGLTRRVETEARFDVRILFFNAFSYRHSNVETWAEDCLVNINALTDANGKVQSVQGQAAGEQFEIVTQDGRETLPACIQSFAYWNPDFLNANVLLNSQTGTFEPVTVREIGRETLDVQGSPVAADRYTITVDQKNIDVWYSTDKRVWLALEAPAKGNRVLRYAPISLPDLDLALDKENRDENG